MISCFDICVDFEHDGLRKYMMLGIGVQGVRKYCNRKYCNRVGNIATALEILQLVFDLKFLVRNIATRVLGVFFGPKKAILF